MRNCQHWISIVASPVTSSQTFQLELFKGSANIPSTKPSPRASLHSKPSSLHPVLLQELFGKDPSSPLSQDGGKAFKDGFSLGKQLYNELCLQREQEELC